MFKRFFGTASEDLRLTVSEALASQRLIIAQKDQRIESLIEEKNEATIQLKDARLEADGLRMVCREREDDLAGLREMLNSVMAQNGAPIAAGSGPSAQIPVRKPSFANSSFAAQHMRRADPPGKPA